MAPDYSKDKYNATYTTSTWSGTLTGTGTGGFGPVFLSGLPRAS